MSVSRFVCVASLLLALASGPALAQAPTTRPLTVHPAVGESIDRQEKATYGLFPYYSVDLFEQARFEQSLAPDSTITLHTQLRDGRTLLRPFTKAEVAAVRQTIEDRIRELGAAAPSQPGTGTAPAATDSVGRRYRVTLRQGTTFDGELTARQAQQLTFLTKDLGTVQVERSNILRLDELNSELSRRPASWFDIGNGNRLFFQPTARNLRRGEGSLQSINLFLLGANYGLTDNVSVGLLTSLVPGVPLTDQFIAFTPKVSGQLSENAHVGGGLLYVRAGGESAGIFYGNFTRGTADNNVTLGLGYGFVSGTVGSTPVVQLGGQTRVSRRVSLLSENYLIADREAGVFGLYGAKINWRRTSLGLAAAYVLPYEGDGAVSTYIIPVYIDFTFRFGEPAR
ncbi:hypothetical protein [Hymenobacter weizhouensis]|uniref:hypothetical protein n=1 Tax=Hymenobacter sp. YIM 151500-1 TaxID=2987689 RepID=UPI0022267172|nr:hypothetical protein [Hymenobacter sp. YIM 151500-1]UYZ62562.1 hypothetical protein OIS53_16370 [Hymenobacter sp. YIM 151500-1]